MESALVPASPDLQILDAKAALVDSGRAVLFDRNDMVLVTSGYGRWLTEHFPRLFLYHHLRTDAWVIAMWVFNPPDGDPHNEVMIELDLMQGNPAWPSYEGWFPTFDYLTERVKGQTDSVKHSLRTAIDSEKVKRDRLIRQNEKIDDLTKYAKRKGMDETAAKVGSFMPISADDPSEFGL